MRLFFRTFGVVGRRPVLFAIPLAFLLVFSLTAAADETVQSRALRPVGEGRGFTPLDVAATGVDFENVLLPPNLKKYLWHGAGGCAGDYDGDGLPDLYLVSEDGENRLFRQEEPWKFRDVTEQAGVGGGKAWGAGATFVDIDNDADLDLYVCNMGSPNLLYINDGKGSFQEAAKEWGLDHDGATWMASFADYDRDGDLDCYLLTYRLYYIGEGNPNFEVVMVDGKPAPAPSHAGEFHFIEGKIQESGRKDVLLRNEGTGAFKDVTLESGIGHDPYHGLSATWWDYNGDGWLDLYVANDFQDPDRLWRNNGDGTFTDVLPGKVSYTSWFSMGADYGDLNRDGWLDFFVADMSATSHYRQKMEMGEMGRSGWFLDWAEPRQLMRNMLYVNMGGKRFLETGFQSGIESTGWTWAARLADLDCDGWEDAIVTNGMIRDVNNSDHLAELAALEKAGKLEERERKMKEFDKPAFEKKMVFRNQGGLSFEDVSEAWNYQTFAASYGLILADFDRDGDLDAVVNNLNDKAEIFRNDLSSGNRMLLELRGKRSNTRGVGATVRIQGRSGKQMRLLTPAHGYLSGDEPVLHFGLGADTMAEEVEITWPSGIKQNLAQLPAGQVHAITEPESGEGIELPAVSREAEANEGAIFAASPELGLDFKHQEDDFDDFEGQPLLPWRMSRLGPGIALGDADGDGDEDIWVGGASWQSGRLFLQSPGLAWKGKPVGPWEKDDRSEDMGAVFFDPDSDGDLDLYVASGGNRAEILDAQVLEDRLYINTGAPGFAKAKPDPNRALRAYESASVVAAGDYDHDGDVDLFVGSRLTAGQFEVVPPQRLLRNTGERLVDVTTEVAPDLRSVGRVTSALWSDANLDGRLDLIVTVAWGAVRVFMQDEGGRLIDHTEKSGLAATSGWWQGIDGGDIDNDGDLDYVVTNLGRNTKYHASLDHPIAVYLNDFDGNGTCDLVEAEYEGATLFPMRGRSCSSEAMPFIREKFKSFDAFAKADLAAIYTPLKLNEAQRLVLNTVDSSVLLNDGEGRFVVNSLPFLAQVAPGFGVVVEDFDGDGFLDAVIAQNFYSPQRETGRMSGGLGAFLQGRGDGTFSEVWPAQSGLWIHEDAKSLAKGDLNNDGVPDLLCGVNNGALKPLLNQSQQSALRWTTVMLEGPKGNPTGIGARLTIQTSGAREIVKEVRAGGGYLSQSTPRQFVALPKGEHVTRVTVRWPTGRTEEAHFTQWQKEIRLRSPTATEAP